MYGASSISWIELEEPAEGEAKGFAIQVLSSPIEAKYFAEGITFHNEEIFMLTWQEKKIFKIDPENLQITETLSGPYNFHHGWGLTSDKDTFYATGGDNSMYLLEPSTLKLREKKPIKS